MWRIQLTAPMDEGQAVGSRGVDARHVLLMINAVTAERDALGMSTYAVIADVEKAFQRATLEATTLALWDGGGLVVGSWNVWSHASRTREWR